MARGFTWAVYETDDGRLFALSVDDDSVLDTNRGWLTVSVGTTNPFPRGWQPRVAVGIDADGHIRHTRIGRVDAPLWTGTASTWAYEASDGSRQTATRIGILRENIKRTPPP